MRIGIKKWAASLFTLAAMGLTASCDYEDLHLPDQTIISTAGGEKTVKCDYCCGVGISDDEGRVVDPDYLDTLERHEYAVRYKWLDVKANSKGSITLTAEPNTTGQKRRLTLWAYGNSNSHGMRVVQEAQ